MGVNSTNQQPAAPGQQMTPQQAAQFAQLQRLRGLATTPYTGNAPNGAAATGVAQLVAALLARRKQQALQNGNPNAGLVVPQPATGPVPLMPQGAAAAPGIPAANPQAIPQALPQQ